MIKAIAIDLDDTLLDTSQLLTPKASAVTFSFMIECGLQLSATECEAKRKVWIKDISHREVFERLAVEFGTDKTRENLEAAIDMFYNFPLPNKLPLLHGALENLDYLKPKYALYLVTAGIVKSQMNKVYALNIEHYFKRIFVVNSVLKKRKSDAFQEIIGTEGIHPSELLCVGNSLLSEIKDALALGATTCYFEYGEERGSLNDLPRAPHYILKLHSELISKCQL